MTDEKNFQRAKELLENFNRMDKKIQDNLLVGVKSMADVCGWAKLADNHKQNDIQIQAAVS